MSTDEEHVDEEHVDKKQLMELYKISLEEARHRDRLYTQTWIAVAISASVFVAAFGFLFKQISVIFECYMTAFRIGLISLGTFLGLFFTYSVFRLAREKKICWDVAGNIERMFLHGKEQSETPKLKDLLVRQKIEHDEPGGCRRVCWALSGQGWRWVYPGTILLAWIAFCVFLFICID